MLDDNNQHVQIAKIKTLIKTREDFIMFAICMEKEQIKKKKQERNDNNLIEKKTTIYAKNKHARV